MDASNEGLRQERLTQVMSVATSRLSSERRSGFAPYAEACLAQLDADDLQDARAEDLAGALLSHWQFGQQRQPGQPKVRLLNPNVAEDGWASRHSVIEIVNDDMPFLVDSTTVEINRQGYTLHAIVHPIFLVERDAAGQLLKLEGSARESWMQIQIDRVVEVERRQALLQGIEAVLSDVRAAVNDWKSML
ncbi:MAG: NAD-glutamate dehydrogenase, partial [Inhella sp.]